jgi:hypothetical protein
MGKGDPWNPWTLVPPLTMIDPLYFYWHISPDIYHQMLVKLKIWDPKYVDFFCYFGGWAPFLKFLDPPLTLLQCMINEILHSVMVLYFRVYTPFHDGDKADADTGTKVWQSLANALILLAVICVMTIVLLLLYKFKCYKVRSLQSKLHYYRILNECVWHMKFMKWVTRFEISRALAREIFKSSNEFHKFHMSYARV